jgi:hypothetical protein
MSQLNAWPAEALSLMGELHGEYGVPGEVSQDFLSHMCTILSKHMFVESEERDIAVGQAMYFDGVPSDEIQQYHDLARERRKGIRQFVGDVASLPSTVFTVEPKVYDLPQPSSLEPAIKDGLHLVVDIQAA